MPLYPPLTVPDKDLSSLHLRFGTCHLDFGPETCPEGCPTCPTCSFWPSGKRKGSSMKLINSTILLGTSLDKKIFILNRLRVCLSQTKSLLAISITN